MTYPDPPGFKVHGTSRMAGRQIAPHAMALRDRVFDFLKAHHRLAFTADEVADRFVVSIILIARPRLSELRHSELIEPTSEGRVNKSGMFARCWRVAGAA
jgi:hypothetical protein